MTNGSSNTRRTLTPDEVALLWFACAELAASRARQAEPHPLDSPNLTALRALMAEDATTLAHLAECFVRIPTVAVLEVTP